MSQVRLAISPARSPALADSSTITRLRSGLRVQLAKTRRSLTSAAERVFACRPGMVKGFEEYEGIAMIVLGNENNLISMQAG